MYPCQVASAGQWGPHTSVQAPVYVCYLNMSDTTPPHWPHCRTGRVTDTGHRLDAKQSCSFTLDWCPDYLDSLPPSLASSHLLHHSIQSTYHTPTLTSAAHEWSMGHLDEMDIWRSPCIHHSYTLTSPLRAPLNLTSTIANHNHALLSSYSLRSVFNI